MFQLKIFFELQCLGYATYMCTYSYDPLNVLKTLKIYIFIRDSMNVWMNASITIPMQSWTPTSSAGVKFVRSHSSSMFMMLKRALNWTNANKKGKKNNNNNNHCIINKEQKKNVSFLTPAVSEYKILLLFFSK